jgi:diaminohydroxyphosphoribosylaminopyrimidine deaminase/5-amino-6-(5-phosphoribosylamino)uracil reductase
MRSLPRDEVMMAECFRLAMKGSGHVSPNPLVGALLVKSGRVLSRGYHRRFGEPHAEIACLRNAGRRAEGATLYVNLEPCTHYGKTPPCVDAIIRAKVGRVVIGMKDPNRIVDGNGIRRLRKAGIRVTVGVLRSQAEQLNRIFVRHITRGYPYVHVKIAQTIDGRIAARGSRGSWFTSEESRREVHRWRAECDAVLVGAGTVRSDDPLLTVRVVRGRNPAVVVLDGRLSSPLKARVFTGRHRRRVFVCANQAYAQRRAAKVAELERRGMEVIRLPGSGGEVGLRQLLRTLYKWGIGSLLVEGGAEVFRAFAEQMMFDELSIFVAPWFMGDGVPAFGENGSWASRGKGKLQWRSAERVGSDLLLKAYVL